MSVIEFKAAHGQRLNALAARRSGIAEASALSARARASAGRRVSYLGIEAHPLAMTLVALNIWLGFIRFAAEMAETASRGRPAGDDG
jgi:hypothetical protein